MPNNTLQDLISGGGIDSGKLENLVRLFLMSGMGRQQPQSNQPPTVNIGGQNILDVTPRNRFNDIGSSIFPALQQLATGYLGNQQRNRQQQFLQQVGQIARSGKKPDEIMADLMPLITQNPQMAKEMGLMDVVKQYQEMAQEKEWKPQTREELLGLERAKAGIKAESPDAIDKKRRSDLLDSTKIREEFLNRPEVKEYVNINTQVRSMDSLFKKAKEGNLQNKVALDQALITMYNKLTDPNSVVRESEYARTPENLPLANRFTGALQKLQKGGAGLTDADREALVWGAKVIANERGTTFNETLQGYMDLSSQYGIDSALISRGLKPHQEYMLGGVSGGSQPSNSTPQVGQMFNGQRIKAIRRKK